MSHPLSALFKLRVFLRQRHLTVSGADLVRNQQLQNNKDRPKHGIKVGRKALTLQEPIFPLAQLHLDSILPIPLGSHVSDSSQCHSSLLAHINSLTRAKKKGSRDVFLQHSFC